MTKVLESVNSFIWGFPVLIGIIGVGAFLTVRTRFAQFRLFPNAIKLFFCQFGKSESNGESSFRALCTALAATVGTGNIAGVAGAIALGGPGAVFWMWICAFLGMSIKFAEATLAVRYRTVTQDGEIVSGPMHIIRNAMGKKWNWLACLYSFFGVIAAFGVGNATQINTLVSSLNGLFCAYGGRQSIGGDLLMGIALAFLIFCIFRGGAYCIGSAAELLVPIASAAYLLLGFGALAQNISMLPQAIESIFVGAFSPKAVTGGMLGSAFAALRVGASRGTFTNEAGMGTAAIAHGAAQVSHPAVQGLMGIIEVFLDTIVICTMTALIILTSGVEVPYGVDAGAALTAEALALTFGPWVHFPLVLALSCFSVATILGWGLYGARCAQFILGEKAWNLFVWVQCAAVVFGAVLKTGTVWTMSEIVNALMAIPNLIMLIALSPQVVRLTREYKIYVR